MHVQVTLCILTFRMLLSVTPALKLWLVSPCACTHARARAHPYFEVCMHMARVDGAAVLHVHLRVLLYSATLHSGSQVCVHACARIRIRWERKFRLSLDF